MNFGVNDTFLSKDGRTNLRILNYSGDGVEPQYYCLLNAEGDYWNSYHSINYIKSKYDYVGNADDIKEVRGVKDAKDKKLRVNNTTKGMGDTEFRVWLKDYIDIMEFEHDGHDKHGNGVYSDYALGVIETLQEVYYRYTGIESN